MIYPLLCIAATMPIPDFTRAGMQSSIEALIPKHTVSASTFGAVADDNVDDSNAIQQAIDAVSLHGGTVALPSGRLILEKRITVRADNVRLQGDNTTLYMPKSLADVYGESKSWSWGSGFIVMSPKGTAEEIGTITKNSPDNSQDIHVEWTQEAPTVGEWIQIWWYNDTGDDSFLAWLYGDGVPPSKYGVELQKATTQRVRSWCKVMEVSEDGCVLDPPLPAPVDIRWNPKVMRVPHLQHCSIDNIAFEFVKAKYPGHLKERGYNAIAINSAIECEVSNVSITNADSGIFLGNCGFTTLRDLHIEGRYMHHPISLSWCSHCLIEDFAILAPHRHGTTISWGSHFNVFHRGRGNELAMDSHRACSFRNLHQNITILHGDSPKQPLRSGGSAPRGLHAARENVYWNIEHIFESEGEPFTIHKLEEWPMGIFVGWHGNRKIHIEPALEGQIVTEVDGVPQSSPYPSQ